MFKKSSFSYPFGCVEVDLDFKKSSFSPPMAPWCVEVKRGERVIAVRDSKNPEGPVLEFTPDEWRAFIQGVENGEFNL